jgi:hypothetical protein
LTPEGAEHEGIPRQLSHGAGDRSVDAGEHGAQLDVDRAVVLDQRIRQEFVPEPEWRGAERGLRLEAILTAVFLGDPVAPTSRRCFHLWGGLC